MKKLTQLIFIVLFMSNLSFAQSNNSKQQWEQFNAANEHSLEIIWDQHSNTFSKMMGKTTQSYGATPDEAIGSFINQHKNLLGIEENDFDLTHSNKSSSKSGTHKYQYQQTYKGVPVLHSGYLISVTKEGYIDYISGDFYNDISTNVNSEISSETAIGISTSELGSDAFNVGKEVQLAIYPNKEENSITFQVVYTLDVYLKDDSNAWKFFVNAKTGEIIEKKSLLSHGSNAKHTPTTSSGIGNKNKTDINSIEFSPLLINGSGTVYTMSPSLNTSTSPETLHRLDNLSPRKLRGDNITVDYYNNTDASSSTGVFNYSTSSAHFDEVMVYYHGDEFESWLIGKGMGNTRVGKVAATTRHNSRYASSTPSVGKIFFMSGNFGLNNPTKEAAVITHEYMHVVSETYNDLNLNLETDAMDEAYSDYFALAYRNETGSVSSSIIGEYIDQPGGTNYTRDLDNSWTMDDYSTINIDNRSGSSFHEKSVIFSGALWDFKNDVNVSSTIADELILESLGNLDSSPSFLDAMYALIAAANSSGYSSYVDDIEDAFIAKKIYVPTLNTSISGPTSLNLLQPGAWSANISNGTAPYSYIWKKKYITGGGNWFQVGTSQSYNDSDTQSFQLRVNTSDASGWDGDAITTVSVSSGGGGCVICKQVALPSEFVIKDNYPNPFNPSTQIKFELPETANVSIKVYNIMGQEVAMLINDQMQAGFHNATFEAGNLASGVYIARLSVIGSSGNQFIREIKMQLIK